MSNSGKHLNHVRAKSSSENRLTEDIFTNADPGISLSRIFREPVWGPLVSRSAGHCGVGTAKRDCVFAAHRTVMENNPRMPLPYARDEHNERKK